MYDKISKSYDDGSLSGCLDSVLVCLVENSGNDFAVDDGSLGLVNDVACRSDEILSALVFRHLTDNINITIKRKR